MISLSLGIGRKYRAHFWFAPGVEVFLDTDVGNPPPRRYLTLSFTSLEGRMFCGTVPTVEQVFARFDERYPTSPRLPGEERT